MFIRASPLIYFSSLFIANAFAATSTCHDTDQVKITFYGYPDNSPPGPGIRCALDSRQDCSGCAGNASRTETASECGPRGETAGGTGSYDDPITMASAATWFCHQEVVYLPYLKKYLRYEDYCQDCTSNATVGVMHIDIWTGSTTTNGGALQDQCERMLTPDDRQPMIRSPAKDLPVDLTKLFDPTEKHKAICNGTTITGGSTKLSSEALMFWPAGLLLLQFFLSI